MHEGFGPRPAEVTMGAQRSRAVVPDALSFPRAALRELVRGRYQVRKLRFELDAEGRGEILYQLVGQGRVFHFFLVSDLLPESVKIDRNFAQGWDAMGVLCEGEWTPQREAHLRREVPRQRAGYSDYDTLMYARGNRSGRIFEHVVDSLANGRQPDMALVAPIGYILRTTAFIGNGQLGTRPLSGYAPDHPFRRPYHAQFFSAFMLREFVFDLVDHLALVRNPDAVRLAPACRRYLGIGNSAATGLAAYAANHARQMQHWSRVHEEALLRSIRTAPVLEEPDAARLEALLQRAIGYFEEASKPGDGVFVPPQQTAAGLRRIAQQLASDGVFFGAREKTISLADLIAWAREHVGGEAVEVLHSLVIELHPEVADVFVDAFLVDEQPEFQPEATAGELLALLSQRFDWMLEDGAAADDTHFWYRCTSAPRDIRRGLRGRLPEHEFENNLEMPRKLRELRSWLCTLPAATGLGSALAARPDLRHVAWRVQALAGEELGVLREAWLSADFQPFGAIRFVLSFYGMEKFEAALPKSVRGTFMQGAPIAEDVEQGRDGTWPYPLMPRTGDAAPAEALAPLPANAGRPVPLGAQVESTAPEHLRIAPGELARMIAVALQGHGMPLGMVYDAAACATFEHARGRPAVRTVLAHAGDRIVEAVVPALAGGAAAPTIGIDAQRRSALATAAASADLAIEAVLAGGRQRCAVRVANAADPWLVRSLVQRCARRGLVAMLVWRAGSESGLVAAGPQGAHGWFAEAAAIPAQLPATASAAGEWPVLDPAFEGCVLACGPATQDGPHAQIEGLAGIDCSGLHVIPSGELQAMRHRWEREGVPISRRDFDALERAGASLLVPQAREHLVLREGADPLKTF